MAIRELGSAPSSSQFAELPTSQYQNKQPQQEINQDPGKRHLCSSQLGAFGWRLEAALPPCHLWSPLVISGHLWSPLVTPDHTGAFS